MDFVELVFPFTVLGGFPLVFGLPVPSLVPACSGRSPYDRRPLRYVRLGLAAC